MSQFDFEFTTKSGTSTGNVAITPRRAVLHAVTVVSPSTSADASFRLYNATSSATGEFARISEAAVGTFRFKAILRTGIFLGHTSSTGESVITWA